MAEAEVEGHQEDEGMLADGAQPKKSPRIIPSGSILLAPRNGLQRFQ